MRHKAQKHRLFSVRQVIPLVGILFVVATAFTQFVTRTPHAAAATASTINFQARLENSSGSIAADGDYNVEFKIYNTLSTGGTAQGVCTGNCVWAETRTSTNKIHVVNGYLTANLGSVTTFGTSINWNQDLWITMNIGGTGTPTWDGEMSPRLKLTAVPYAMQAGGLSGGSGSNTTVLDTGTPSGNNVLHLPAESGTLCVQSSANCGFLTGTAGSYIQNGTGVQSAASFNIASTVAGSPVGALQAAGSATAPVLLLKGGATPSTGGDLLQLQDSSSNILTYFDSKGYMHLSRATANTDLVITSRVSGDTNDRLTVAADGRINWGSGSGASDINLSRTNPGELSISNQLIVAGGTQIGTPGFLAKLSVQPGSAATIGEVIRGFTSQSADLLQLQNSGGNVLASFSSAGALTLGRSAATGALQTGSTAYVDGSNTSGFAATLSVGTLTASRAIFLPDAGGTICTTVASTCSSVYSSAGGTYINKNAQDTSSASVASAALLAFSNTDTGASRGLDVTSAGTASTVLITGSGNPTSGNATLKVVNSNGTPTGNLLDLQVGSTSKFAVSAAGQVVLAGGQSPDITTVGAATASAITLQPGTSSGASSNGPALNLTGGNASGTTSVTAGAVAIQGGNATGASGTRNGGAVTIDGGTGATANGVVSIGGTNSPTVNIGSVGTTAKATAIHIGDTTTTTAGAIQSVTIGSSSNLAHTTIIQGGNSNTAGSEAIQITPQTTGGIAIGSTTGTGTITLGQSSAANIINIGSANFTAANTQTINIANGSQSTAASTLNVNILSGAAGNSGTARLNLANNDRVTQVDIGNVAADAARTLNLFTGNSAVVDTLNIGTGATTVAGGKTIHIGDGTPTGSGTNLITIGSIAALGNTTTIQGGNGTGAVSVQAAASGTISIGTTNANTVNVGSTAATTTTIRGGSGVNIGDGGTTGAIQIGNTTGGVAQTISIGTNATASATNTINIGSGTTSSGTVTVNAGTGSGNLILLQSNNATGGVKIKSATNSTAAFLIQDSGTNSYISVDTSGAAISVGYASSTTTLNGTVKVTTLGAATGNSASVCRDTTTNILTGCNTTGTGANFVQGGNSFGATGLLGTNDTNNLQIETNAIVRATFDQSNGLYLGNGITAATPNNFTVAGTGSATAGTAGGQLAISGGAGATTTTGSAGGALNLNGGNAGGTGNNNGGNVSVQGGTATGSGTVGSVILQASGGNVGIGTTPNSAYKLDVAGDINISSGSKFRVNGADINTGGTLNNVAYLDQNNSFTGKNTFSRNGTGTGDYTLGVTGAPVNDATSSLIRVGNAIAGGNAVANGGTYIGINTPSTGAGSAADFVNFQANGTVRLQVTNAGNVTVGGTYNTNTFTASGLQFGAGSTATVQSAASQALNLTGHATSAFSTDAGDLGISAAANLNIGNTGGTAINIGTNAGAHTIGIGTGAAVQAITIGSQNTTSTAVINGGNASTGVGAVSVQAASGGLITIGTTNNNTLTLGGVSSTVNIGNLGAASANGASVCRDTSTTQLISCDANTSGKPFLQGGNSFGATAVLGTNDTNNLQLKTNNIVRATLDQSNGLYLGNGITAAAPNNFTVAGTGSTTAGTAGATLTLQGGAGASTTTGSAGGGLTLTAGSAGGSGNNAGGNLLLQGGARTGTGTAGSVIVRPQTDSTSAFLIQNSASSPLFQVDTVNNRVGINVTGNPVSTLQVTGTLRLDGISLETFTTPVGSPVTTKINIPVFDPGNNNQILALGLPSTTVNGTSRAISLFDARAFAHQPTLAVFSPDEANIIGLNWNGSNSVGYLMTTDSSSGSTTAIGVRSGANTGGNNSGTASFQSGAVSGGSGQISGAVILQSGDGAGTNSSSGAITVDSGAKTGSGTAGTVNIGVTNATSILLGNGSSTVTLQGGTTKLTNVGAATANAASLCRDTVTTNLISCDTNTSGRPFLQGGNSFGATAVLGTNDTNNLQFETNGVVRGTFDQSNNLFLGNGATAAAPNNFAIQGTGSTTAGTAGATLTLQGGAGASTTTGSVGGGLNLSGGNAGGSGNNAGGNVTIGGGSATGTGTKGGVVVKNAADSATAFQVQNSAGTVTTLDVDTANGRVGIGTNAPARQFDVAVNNAVVNALPILVEQAGTGDSGLEVRNTTGNYYVGVDTSDGNRFKINSSAAANTNVTFGNAAINIGTATTDSGDVSVQNGLKATSGAAGTLTSISVYINGGSAANQYSVAIYADGGGAPSRPSTLIASSANANIIPNSWNTIPISASIAATTTYWIAFNTNDGTANMKFDTSAGSNVSCFVARTFSLGWSTPFGGSCTLGNQNFGLYANYYTTTSTDNFANSLFSMGATGDTIFRNSVNSTAAFQIQTNIGTSLLTADTTSSSILLGASAGTTTLQGTVKVSTVGATTANAAALCRDTSTTNLISCDANTTGKPFLQGGNTFGATASLGTNDANNLTIKTANVVRATFDQSNALYLGLGATNAAPTAFTVAATGSSTAGTAGATLTIQGGAGMTTGTGSAGGGLTLAGGNSTGGSGNNNGGIVTLQGGSSTNTGTPGYVLVKNVQNSSTAFQVQDASAALFTVAAGQRMVYIGATQAGTSSATPAFMYLSDISSNAAGNAQLTGQWNGTTNWGIGANSNAADNVLRIGITSATAGNAWNTTAQMNLLVAGTLRVMPNGTTDSVTALQVQKANGGAVVLDVDTSNARVGIGTNAPSFDLSFGGATNRVLGVETQGTANTAGVSLTVRGATGNGTGAGGAVIVQGGQGGATGQGGNLTLQSGAAGGGNNNGGTLNVTGGAGAGTGATGLVVINTPTFQTASTQTCAVSCTITQANLDSNGAVVITASAASLNVTMNDPTITTAGRIVYVTAALGSNDFTLIVNGGGTGNQIAMRANTTATMVWNGTDWTAAGASSSTTLQAAYDNTLTSAGGAELVVASTANANGLTIRDSATNSVNGTLLEVQSSTAANLFSVNSNVTDYATDAGAETAGASSTTFPASTWSANGSAAVSRYTTTAANIATGVASVAVTTTAAAGDGVKNTLSTSLTANNHYNVSFTARLTSGTFTDMDVYYSINGTATSVLCQSGQAVKTSVWTKVNCTFTAPSSGITGTNAILIRQTTGTVRTVYIDNLSVTIAANFNLATDGGVDDAGNFTTNWTYSTGTGTGTVTRNTSDGNDASDSAQVAITAGAANAGVRNKLAINPLQSTLYRISVYAKLNSGAAFTDFKVRYSRDAGTSFVDCTDYNTQTVVTTGWTQITCYVTTDGTAPTNPYVYFAETASGVRTYSVDTFSITLAQNTTPNVQIGGGLNGGPVTLFTLDRGASAPIAANNDSMLGSMYYDTSLGKLQCYEADGWGACGSSPDNIVTISPEYTNAVLHGTGIGTMTSDLCSDGLNVNDGSSGQPTICGTNETYNFYKWTSPQASAQTYSIYVTYQLPTTFKTFQSGTTSIMGRTDSTNATVQYTILRNSAAGLTQCGSTVPVSTGISSSWGTGTASGAADPSTCGFVGGNSVVFKIDVIASVNANAYVGNLGFTFTNQ